jgi:membrane-anchored protein YejM (alkaline phosphatase superfamily)
MAIAEKIILLICLFSGFFWLRQRARHADLERQISRSLIGVFVLLPAILVGEQYLFEQVHFGAYTDLLLKVMVACAAFPIIGYGFIRIGDPDESLESAGDPGESKTPPES